ncbi:MAG: hypothetical protein CME01_07825 [Geminicoccus sp.]|nr:hypothetical protein [Geminicoccus sp.]
MSLAISAYAPEPLFTRRAHRQNMARAAKAFSAISLGAAFVLTTGEAGAQSARASAENGFAPINGTPMGFNDDGDLVVLMANGQETIIPRGEYGLVGDQIMVSDMIEGIEVAQNGYIPPTSGVPVYGSPGLFGLGYAAWLIPLGLVATGVLAYIYLTRVNNEGPAFAAASYSESFDENDTGTVVTVSATDDEDDTFTYSLSGDDSSHFSISTAGAITFTNEPNFEAPGDSDRDNEYVFTATATDEHGESNSVTVTIDVDNVAEAASSTATAFTGTTDGEDLAVTGAATDIDMAGGNDSVELQAGIAASGTIDMGSGNDYLHAKTGAAAGTGASIDLGSGNDEIEIDVDLTNDVTIDLGGGNDIVDIDAAQTAATHTIENFGSGDVLDLRGLSMTGDVDLTVYSTTTAATSAITTATSVTLLENGTDIEVYIDASGDGSYGAGDMVLTLDDVSALTAGHFDL